MEYSPSMAASSMAAVGSTGVISVGAVSIVAVLEQKHNRVRLHDFFSNLHSWQLTRIDYCQQKPHLQRRHSQLLPHWWDYRLFPRTSQGTNPYDHQSHQLTNLVRNFVRVVPKYTQPSINYGYSRYYFM